MPSRLRSLLFPAITYGCVAGSEGPRGPGAPTDPDPGLQADLAAGTIEAPDQVRLDSALEMRVGVRNHGSRSAGPGWFIRVFLSTDRAIEPSDIQVDQFLVLRELPAGAEDQYLRVKKLVRSTPTGRYFLGSILDVTGVVPETNEGNNTLSLPATITLTPELPPPQGD